MEPLKQRNKKKMSKTRRLDQTTVSDEHNGNAAVNKTDMDDGTEPMSHIFELETLIQQTEDHHEKKRLKKKLRNLRRSQPQLQDSLDRGVSLPEVVQTEIAAKELTTGHKNKRRKVSFAEQASSFQANQDTPPLEEDVVAPGTWDGDSSTLPHFPDLKTPTPPSPKLLYRQSLDKAVAESEVLNSTSTSSLDLSINNESIDPFGMDGKSRRRLAELGISELFAVQAALIPFLLREDSAVHHALYRQFDPPRDVCVSAPTGSGKTLAYAIPIMQTLSTRVITRLRALVVLPTRDLVAQVHSTFESLREGRHLKIAAVSGQHAFLQEQQQLSGNLEETVAGGSSKVDVLICTPGRLVDHLVNTRNFSLQHLRFLVIDEADRLLGDIFQDWLPQVLAAIDPPPDTSVADIDYTKHNDSLAPHWLPPPTWLGNFWNVYTDSPVSSCQKLILSATLTRDPAKVSALKLRNPKYFSIKSPSDPSDGVVNDISAKESFTLPASLTESCVSMNSSDKPLYLFYMIKFLGVKDALVFTKSTESTARLATLLECFEESSARHMLVDGDLESTSSSRMLARAYSSDLSSQDRKSTLKAFKSGEVQILICSDIMARGMDIENVSHVVNYDVPLDIRRYVHRVGRTARAGRPGNAWTLIENQEARHFKAMMKAHDRWQRMKKLTINQTKMDSLRTDYQEALAGLKKSFGAVHMTD